MANEDNIGCVRWIHGEVVTRCCKGATAAGSAYVRTPCWYAARYFEHLPYASNRQFVERVCRTCIQYVAGGISALSSAARSGGERVAESKRPAKYICAAPRVVSRRAKGEGNGIRIIEKRVVKRVRRAAAGDACTIHGKAAVR